jgi:hypothetical protein
VTFVAERARRACGGLEARIGLPLSALVVGLGLVAAAAILSRPSLGPVNHGALYARLSEAPLSLAEDNWVQLRILGPLVGYVLFLRGGLFPLLPLAFLVLFLSSIYLHYRRSGVGHATSLGIAGLMAFSTPTLFPLSGAGYVDPIVAFLLFWCFARPGLPFLQGLLFTLAIFTHESALFALPWVLMPSGPGQPRRWRSWLMTAGLCALGIVLLFAWREYATAQIPVRFSNDFYLGRIGKNWRIIRWLLPLGVFMAFRLFWALPVLAAFDAVRRRDWHASAWLSAVVGGAVAQLVFAHDVSRLMGLAFPAVLKGADLIRRERGEPALERLLWALILWNLLVPAYEVRPPGVYRFVPLWWGPFFPPTSVSSWPPAP